MSGVFFLRHTSVEFTANYHTFFKHGERVTCRPIPWPCPTKCSNVARENGIDVRIPHDNTLLLLGGDEVCSI